MTEDDEVEEGNTTDIEELKAVIEREREERREQISFEWAETVRVAGELWREVGDVETVADDLDLSLEKTKEALTVYRLIFEDPSDVAVKASRPSRAYFSLEKELGEEFDEEEEDDPVEDLLREYVGALYLDHDIGELPVREPPERETPPMGFDWQEMDIDWDELVPSFEIPESTISAVANMPKLDDAVVQSQVSVVANMTDSEMFMPEAKLANAIQPVIDQQNRVLSQSLAPLTAALEQQQNMIARSTVVMMSEAIQDIAFPDSVLADLAAIQPAMNAAAAATTHTHPSSEFEESVVDEASTTSVEAEPVEATVETVSETEPVDATLDAGIPDSTMFTTELVFEIPAMMVESILSTGRARTWFTGLSEDYQIAAVRVMLATSAFYFTGNLGMAAFAALLAPAVRQMVLEE